jgi:predicted nicotinamide N-methyase
VAIPKLPSGSVKILTLGEIPIELLVQLNALGAEISGRRVWPGSVLLSIALTEVDRSWLAGASVLELGAGGGLAAMCAARLGATQVVATDGDQTSVELLHRNLEVNGMLGAAQEAICARRLLWGAGDHNDAFRTGCAAPAAGFDVILAADVMYKHGLPALLFESVALLLRPGGRCLLCHLPRGAPFVMQEHVCAAARQAGLAIVEAELVVGGNPGCLPLGEHCTVEEAAAARLYIVQHTA